MISYWPLDDVEVAPPITFEDVVGSPANDGSCDGVFCPGSVAGRVSYAYEFDFNDGITVEDSPSLNFTGDDSFSFEVWIKTTQDCSTENKVFIGKYATVLGFAWWLGCGQAIEGDPLSDDVAIFFLEDDSHARFALRGVTPVNDDTWHHVVGVRDNDADQNRLYVDGNLDGSTTLNYLGTFTNVTELTIGYLLNGYHLIGRVDEAAIYNQALAPEAIQAHFNGGIGQSYCTDAPTAVDDVLNTDEDIALNFAAADLLSNDTDPDGPAPSIDSIDSNSSEGGTIANLGGGTYRYTPPEDFNGTDAFTYTIIDETSLTDVGDVAVTVDPVNDLPEVTNPGAKTNNEGASPSMQILATDADADDLAYSATSLPGGLNINAATGLISGIITQTAAEDSPYNVTVNVFDGTATVNVPFIWTVNAINVPPVLTQPQNQFNLPGDAVSLQIEAGDPDGDGLQYSANGLPQGLTINSSGLISGTIAESAGNSSPFTVMVTVAELGTDDDFEDQRTFTWTVKDDWFVFLPLSTNSGP
jgi:hypothetical protein